MTDLSPYEEGLAVDLAKARKQIKAQAAEIERLRDALERSLSVAKDIEKACRGLRDEAQPITAKDAVRKMIAELKGQDDE